MGEGSMAKEQKRAGTGEVRQEQKQKAKDLCRRVSPIMTGQSPTNHRTEPILPESKHSLKA